VTTTFVPGRQLHWRDFLDDPHASRYRGELDVHPDAMRRLIALLNEPANEQRLLDAETHGMPALAGIAPQVEGEPLIETILRSGTDGMRFRQTVGVAVKLKMARLGWRTTGRKGTVRGARYFTKAERYRAEAPESDDYAERARAALMSVHEIGDEHEREATGRDLLNALRATRAEEGRAF
jgi:hypothetical protein